MRIYRTMHDYAGLYMGYGIIQDNTGLCRTIPYMTIYFSTGLYRMIYEYVGPYRTRENFLRLYKRTV